MTASGVHKERIKAELRVKHGSLLAFERAKSLPIGSVKDVLRGRSSKTTEQAIADELGKDVHVLFPHRHLKDGESSTKVDDSASPVSAHRLTARAS